MPHYRRSLLADYLVDAAKLRLDVLPFEEDVEFINGGGRIFYAIDTNIIHLYLEPEKMGPRSDRGGGFSKIFSSDGKDTSVVLADAFARFIFKSLAGEMGSLLLLHGHDDEVRDLCNMLAKKSEEQFSTLENEVESLEEILADLVHIETEKSQVEYLAIKAPNIVSFLFYEQSPSEELRRISQLLCDKRIMKIPVYVGLSLDKENGSSIDKPLAKALLGPANLQEIIHESSLRSEWLSRLRNSIGSKQLRNNKPFKRDVSALARLEYINSKIGDDAKVVLITGDRALTDACRSYFPVSERNRSFSDSYIRHPRAFLSVPEVLVPGEVIGSPTWFNQPELKTSWLDTILAEDTASIRLNDEKAFRQSLKPKLEIMLFSESSERNKIVFNKVDRIYRENPHSLKNITDSWAEHTSSLKNAHIAKNEKTVHELEKLVSELVSEGGQFSVTKLQERISKKNEDTWKVFYRMMAQAGIDLIANDTDENIRLKRFIPLLDFDSSPTADKLIKLFAYKSSLLSKDLPEIYELQEQLSKEDPSGYAKIMVFASLYMLKGYQYVGAKLATGALALADRELAKSNGQNGITGREALYFLSVLTRSDTNNEAGIVKATEYLEEAENRLFSYRAHSKDKSKSGHRIRVEFLAIRLSKISVTRKTISDSECELELKDILTQVDKELEKLEKMDGKFSRDWLERTLFISYFNAIGYLVQIDRVGFAETEKARKYSKRLDVNLKSTFHSDNYLSKLPWSVYIVVLFALSRFGDRTESLSSERNYAMSYLEEKDSSESSIGAKHDRERYLNLLKQSIF